MDNENWISKMQDAIREDLEMLCGECRNNEGVLRTMAYNLGVNNSAAIVEAAVEGMPNGDDAPYPAIHFNITLAKDVDPEYYGNVAQVLNDINVITSSGVYPSFGNFCLYKPLGQIYYNYRIPVNVGAFDAERENLRFFLATVFEQLDMFVDLVLFASQGNESLTIEAYLDYLDKVDDLNNIDQRIELLKQTLDEIEKELKKEMEEARGQQ